MNQPSNQETNDSEAERGIWDVVVQTIATAAAGIVGGPGVATVV